MIETSHKFENYLHVTCAQEDGGTSAEIREALEAFKYEVACDVIDDHGFAVVFKDMSAVVLVADESDDAGGMVILSESEMKEMVTIGIAGEIRNHVAHINNDKLNAYMKTIEDDDPNDVRDKLLAHLRSAVAINIQQSRA